MVDQELTRKVQDRATAEIKATAVGRGLPRGAINHRMVPRLGCDLAVVPFRINETLTKI